MEIILSTILSVLLGLLISNIDLKKKYVVTFSSEDLSVYYDFNLNFKWIVFFLVVACVIGLVLL